MSNTNKRLLFTASGILVVLGLSLAFWVSSSRSSKVATVTPTPETFTTNKDVYELEYSEQQYIVEQVKKNENFLVYWATTYVGYGANDYQNNTSLMSVDIGDLGVSGEYTGVSDLYLKYPTLNGVVSDVFSSYFYNSDDNTLVQMLTIERSAVRDRKRLYVVYSRSGEVLTYWVATEPLTEVG